MLAVACHHRVGFGGITCRVDELARRVPARAWQCVSAGAGAKGHRLYDWALARLDHDGPLPADQAGRHWLMVRRNRATGELAFYRCFTPRPTPLAVLVKVAGRRWTIEERFSDRQGPVRPGPAPASPLARLIPLGDPAMVAHAFLVVAAQAERSRSPASPELIELSCKQVSHLFAAWSPRPLTITPTGWPGRCGGDAIRHAPGPATTVDKPPGTHEHTGRFAVARER